MLSVVVCSIHPELADGVRENVERTAGVPTDVCIFDNREKCWPIAKVYNYCASVAKYEKILFLHEDTEFLTSDWARPICNKLDEEDCGCIGFAGSAIRLATYSRWVNVGPGNVFNFIQKYNTGLYGLYRSRVSAGNFDPVVCIDGMAIFVSKQNWRENPFDEDRLKGFHCYDIDFSLQMHNEGRCNYVYMDKSMLFCHNSEGSYNALWLEDTVRMQRDKWASMTPAYAKNMTLSEKSLSKYTMLTFADVINSAIDNADKSTCLNEIVEEFAKIYGKEKSKRCLYSNKDLKRVRENRTIAIVKQMIKAGASTRSIRNYLASNSISKSKKMIVLAKFLWYRKIKIKRGNVSVYNSLDEVVAANL